MHTDKETGKTMAKESGITERAMQYIKEKIESGAWPVGSKIPSENQLCIDIGCSRTSIRSALQRYNVLGVIESQHGRGSFVRSGKVFLPGDGRAINDFQEIRSTENDSRKLRYWDWRQARGFLEPEIGYLAAQKATDEFVEKLQRINAEQRSMVGNPQKFIEKDIEFHMALAEFVGNPFLVDMMRYLMNAAEMHTLGNDEFGYMGGVYYHAMITDAIARRNPEQTRELLIKHQKNWEAVIVRPPGEGDNSEKDIF